MSTQFEKTKEYIFYLFYTIFLCYGLMIFKENNFLWHSIWHSIGYTQDCQVWSLSNGTVIHSIAYLLTIVPSSVRQGTTDYRISLTWHGINRRTHSLAISESHINKCLSSHRYFRVVETTAKLK